MSTLTLYHYKDNSIIIGDNFVLCVSLLYISLVLYESALALAFLSGDKNYTTSVDAGGSVISYIEVL